MVCLEQICYLTGMQSKIQKCLWKSDFIVGDASTVWIGSLQSFSINTKLSNFLQYLQQFYRCDNITYNHIGTQT